MKPVAKGVTKKFIRITDDKEAFIKELRNSIDRNFTGRIQGILRTSKGELELVIEVLNGRIVAAGVEGYNNVDGGLALNTIVSALLDGTGFLEIIELNKEGVDLDLEFNPNSKLSAPTSLDLYIDRIELRLRQLMRKKELEQQRETTTTPPPRREEEKGTTFQQYARRTEYEQSKPFERRYDVVKEKTREPEKETKKTVTVKSRRIEKKEQEEAKKKVLEEIGLDEEVLEGLVVNVREKPVVIEAIPSTGTAVPETKTPLVEKPVTSQPIVEEKVEEIKTAAHPQVRAEELVPPKPVGPSPEEVLSKLPLSDRIEEFSKSLLSEVERLLISLIETKEVLSHGRERIDIVFEKLIDLSKDRDEPLKLGTATAGKLYYVIAHKGSIVSAFKVDENSENIELYGRAALVDLFKKLVSDSIDYMISPVRSTYILLGLGLIRKEEAEKEIESRAEGLFGRLKKIFGGH